MSKTNLIENFIAGGIGGACRIATGHPFDTVKVRLQTMSSKVAADGSGPMYTGALDCVRKTIKNEGFRALYKGMATPLISSIPLNAIFFGSCAVGRWFQQTHPNQKLSTFQNIYAGAFASLCTSSISIPCERIKCLLQIQSNENIKKYDGPLDALKKIYNEGGIRSIYRGTVATLMRNIPSSAIYISTYQYLKDRFSTTNKSDTATFSPMASFFAGGFAGIFSSSACIPVDVIKSRLQTAPIGKYKNGMRSVFKEILKYEGFRGFFRGFVPLMFRAFPASAACFLGIEQTLDIIRLL